jgi:hypothetical protein
MLQLCVILWREGVVLGNRIGVWCVMDHVDMNNPRILSLSGWVFFVSELNHLRHGRWEERGRECWTRSGQ